MINHLSPFRKRLGEINQTNKFKGDDPGLHVGKLQSWDPTPGVGISSFAYCPNARVLTVLVWCLRWLEDLRAVPSADVPPPSTSGSQTCELDFAGVGSYTFSLACPSPLEGTSSQPAPSPTSTLCSWPAGPSWPSCPEVSCLMQRSGNRARAGVESHRKVTFCRNRTQTSITQLS